MNSRYNPAHNNEDRFRRQGGVPSDGDSTFSHPFDSRCSNCFELTPFYKLSLPCGHSLCRMCRSDLDSFDCPMCGCDITSALPIFVKQNILRRQAMRRQRQGSYEPTGDDRASPEVSLTISQIDVIVRKAIEDALRLARARHRREFP